MIRPARADEVEALRSIEKASGALFADIGMHSIAEATPMPAATVAGLAAAGRVWVAVDGDDRPVGWAAVELVDGHAHLEQLSVLPSHGRRGFGAALVEHVCGWAAAEGHDAVTLTTFREVAWNAPFYERLGFRALTEDELTPALRAVRAHEAELGLDPDIRAVMRRDL